MFDILNQNLAYEEEWGDDFSSSSEEWNFDDNLDDQFVEVSNPQFLETMLSNDGAPLNALIDFHSELLLKPIDTPIKFPEEKIIISTPTIQEIETERNANESKTMKKLFENEEEEETNKDRKTTGGKSLHLYAVKSPVSQKAPEKIHRKTGGKSLKQIQQTYSNQKPQRKNNGSKTLPTNNKSTAKKQLTNSSSIFSEESIEIVDDLPSPNSKKRKNKPNKTLKKKNKSNAIDVDTPSEMIYDILTNDLDTPHKKATTLEKKLSKVFMGEEILKIMKDDEEDEDIDSI